MYMREFIVTHNESGQTLEKYVKKLLRNAPLSFIYKTFRKEDVALNGKRVKKETIINENDVIRIYISEDAFNSFIPSNELVASDTVKDWVVYEDDNILAINKPKGVLVTKDDKDDGKCLEELVLEYLYYKGEYDPENAPTLKPGPAHRLDRNTSGIVLFGKNIEALQALFEMMKDKNALGKKYYALVKGIIDKGGVIDAPLLKEENNTVRVASLKDGAKSAVTTYTPIQWYSNYTLMDITLHTGRTHQIRVHFSYIGHPVVGDAKYGDFELNKVFKEEFNLKSQFLEAYEIDFINPIAPLEYLKGICIQCELSEEYKEILSKL